MRKTLLAELFGCVQIQPDPGHPEVRRPLVSDDIEEIDTRALTRRRHDRRASVGERGCQWATRRAQ